MHFYRQTQYEVSSKESEDEFQDTISNEFTIELAGRKVRIITRCNTFGKEATSIAYQLTGLIRAGTLHSVVR